MRVCGEGIQGKYMLLIIIHGELLDGATSGGCRTRPLAGTMYRHIPCPPCSPQKNQHFAVNLRLFYGYSTVILRLFYGCSTVALRLFCGHYTLIIRLFLAVTTLPVTTRISIASVPASDSHRALALRTRSRGPPGRRGRQSSAPIP